jgi:predicted  nucleic acid-binding Zn-ribbon protein
MLAALEQLLVIQDRDRRLRRLQLELGGIPEERKALETRLAAAQKKLDDAKARLRDLELEKKKLEIDAQSKRDQVGKYRAQQFQTRKNEEFQALGNEIKRTNEEIVTIEDRELEVMQEAEDLKPKIAEAEAEFQAAKTDISRQLADLDSKGQTLAAEAAAVGDEREKLAVGADENLLDRYDRLRQTKGDAVAALERGICMGCHMKVTVQTATRVKGEREVVTCDQCGRILYFSE